jgi:hypothetical protein
MAFLHLPRCSTYLLLNLVELRRKTRRVLHKNERQRNVKTNLQRWSLEKTDRKFHRTAMIDVAKMAKLFFLQTGDDIDSDNIECFPIIINQI